MLLFTIYNNVIVVGPSYRVAQNFDGYEDMKTGSVVNFVSTISCHPNNELK